MYKKSNKDKIENLFKKYNNLELEYEYRINFSSISDEISGKNILLIGAGGTIGQSVLTRLLDFNFESITLVDNNENELVRILRRVRANKNYSKTNINIIPISITDPLFNLWLESQIKFEIILNFAAIKHVRSERDNWSIANLLNINVLALYSISNYAERNHAKFFSVSTDKAANPSNIMGASKKLMEILLSQINGAGKSARFANVAFSNGSLLESWELKLRESQVLSVPRDCKRYLISKNEASLICMLSTFDGNQENLLYIPNNNLINSILLTEALKVYLDFNGLKPQYFSESGEAWDFMDKRKSTDPWPVILTELDTYGEKLEEELIAPSDTIDQNQKYVSLIQLVTQGIDQIKFESIIQIISDSVANPKNYTVSHFKELLSVIAPSLNEHNNYHNLDSRI
jgi:dTDP-4-dehydrorhamnose reductase